MKLLSGLAASCGLVLLISGLVVTPVAASSVPRPLVGAIDYSSWSGTVARAADIASLTPPTWASRLPFYASTYDDISRLKRTSNTAQSIVYKTTSDVTGYMIYTAFNGLDTVSVANDIKIYVSNDGSTYSQWTSSTSANSSGGFANVIAGATDYQKVNFWSYNHDPSDSYRTETGNIPSGTRYLKVEIAKTTGTTLDLPQIMRVEVNTGVAGAPTVQDDLNDFSKVWSHTTDLAFDATNSSKFRIVTGGNYDQATVNSEIDYLKASKVDYLTVFDYQPFSYTATRLPAVRTAAAAKGFSYAVMLDATLLAGEAWSARIPRLVGYFADTSYQKVSGGRPLMYMFTAVASSDLTSLRNASIAAGRGNPFLVCLNSSSGCDAGGDYIGTPTLDVNDRGTGQTVPNVTLWANDAPRATNPPPWGGGNLTNTVVGSGVWVSAVKNAFSWVSTHASSTSANTILLCAWNEYAEDSSFGPTLNPDGSANTTAVSAMSEAIRTYQDGWYVDSGIKQWNGSSWTAFTGTAVRTTVDSAGYPWIVNDGGQVYQWTGSSWTLRMSSGAQDIGAGSDGTIAVVGSDIDVNGGRIWKWTGSAWNELNTAARAVRVDVAPSGDLWVVNRQGYLYQYSGGSFVERRGVDSTADVGVGDDGTVAVVSILGDTNSGGATYKWNGSSWTSIAGFGTSIDVDAAGNLWVTNTVGDLYQQAGTSWTLRRTGGTHDVGIGNGNVFIVG